MGVNSFGVSCGGAQDRDDWRLRTKGQLASRGSPVKWCMWCSVSRAGKNIGFFRKKFLGF